MESETITTTTTRTVTTSKKSASKQLKEIEALAKKEAVQEIVGATPTRSRKDRMVRQRTTKKVPDVIDSGLIPSTQDLEEGIRTNITFSDSDNASYRGDDSNEAFTFQDDEKSSSEDGEFEEEEHTEEEEGTKAPKRKSKTVPTKSIHSRNKVVPNHAPVPKRQGKKIESKFHFFEGLKFIITSPPTTDQPQSSQNSETKEIIRIVQECGGEIITDEDIYNDNGDLEDRPLILLATKEFRSIKYLYGLAMDVPLLHFQWVRDCYEQKKKIDPSTNAEYWLNCGRIDIKGTSSVIKQKTNRDLLSSARNVRVFYNNSVYMIGSKRWVNMFNGLLKVAGANVLTGSSEIVTSLKSGDFVFIEDPTDSQNYGRIIALATEYKIPVVTKDYIIESLIENTRVAYHSRHTVNYDALYSKTAQPKSTESGSPKKNYKPISKKTSVSETHTTDDDSQSSSSQEVNEPATPSKKVSLLRTYQNVTTKPKQAKVLEVGDHWTSDPFLEKKW
jgi:RNase H-fold protein (predicted Holliday junction resolvase)